MAGYIGTKAVSLSTTAADVSGDATIDGTLTVGAGADVTGTVTADGLTVDGKVKIALGTALIDADNSSTNLTVHDGDGSCFVAVRSDNVSDVGILFGDSADDFAGGFIYQNSGDILKVHVNNAERLRIDSSGNLLVGKITTSFSTAGSGILSTGEGQFVRSGNAPVNVNRLSSDGSLIGFYKDGTTVGSIHSQGGVRFGLGNISTGLLFNGDNSSIHPWNTSTNASRDNAIDSGNAQNRWDDVYATNGTIQTSDANEKQQIAELTAAEMQAAKAISKLFKTFKWNDSVAEKGDDARIHSGVIAQEVEAAMTDAGLDAGRYAFFISTTWWESTEVIPAVEEVLDEEGNVVTEAQPERTVTHTHETAEEAPIGAVERNRKGIRYPQLLSFIGAATEQRLASIEARLDTLEGN